MPSELVFVNPWIYDFAAYDLWSKPLGLLLLAARLRSAGHPVRVIDCLDRPGHGESASGLRTPPNGRYGTGKFPRERVKRPPTLNSVPRSYSRYGLSPQEFVRVLESIHEPAALLTSCLMTYWYPGLQEVVRLFRMVHPHVPVILGGTYARLCTAHALRCSGADHVLTEAGAEAVQAVMGILNLGNGSTSSSLKRAEKESYPALDLYENPRYAPILTSTGCPFRCSYCASGVLYPEITRRDPKEVVQEILFWHMKFGIRDFAFYDDALLAGAESHAAIFLEEIAQRNLPLRFHTPNALHVREIHRGMARLLFRAGFRTIRLGLETSDLALHRKTGNKVSEGEFEDAVRNLQSAGFGRRDIGAYILMGLPGQAAESVRDTVLLVQKVGVMPYLAEYSPIPHTPLWSQAVASSEFDLASEPLYHNNSLLPCWGEEEKSKVPQIREMVRRIRQAD